MYAYSRAIVRTFIVSPFGRVSQAKVVPLTLCLSGCKLRHMETRCSKCSRVKVSGKRCGNCKRLYNAAYYKTHASELSKSSRNRHRQLREAALKAYGGKCVCCGENRAEFLAIDHKEGGGNQHRKELFGRTSGDHRFYFWLKKNRYPDRCRILCHNCNTSMGIYGYCPHQKEMESPECPCTSMTTFSPQKSPTETE